MIDTSGGGRPPSHRHTPAPAGRILFTLVGLAALLMVFSIILWLLGDQALAATAGAGALALVADIARRLLTASDSPDASAADSTVGATSPPQPLPQPPPARALPQTGATGDAARGDQPHDEQPHDEQAA